MFLCIRNYLYVLIFLVISSAGSVAHGENLSKSVVKPSPVLNRVEVFQSFDALWKKHPHRLSILKIRVPGTSNPNDPGAALLGGGTWANGKGIKSDISRFTLKTAFLTGGRFFFVSTPEFELVQVYNGDGKNFEVTGTHSMTVPSGDFPAKTVPAIWVNGFSIKPGRWHTGRGVTITGLSFSVESVTRKEDAVTVKVRFKIGFAGEPVRTATQDFELYYAIVKMHLGIGFFNKDIRVSSARVNVDRKLSYRAWCGYLTKKACALRDMPETAGLLKRFSISLKHRGIHSGRYIRRLSISASQSTAGDVFDNCGLIAREVKYRVSKELILVNNPYSFSEACYRGVSGAALNATQ